MHTTLMSVLLVPLERCVTALRPTPWIIRMTVWTADVVNAVDEIIG